ncbi:nucleotidyltransferase family protein [Roseovarius sp. EL26]|uniref:nucleotidyltransferase family protein n=1 Tax=Roseovarius sp. EL26 TaxID=2126672 RepID=UPI000EA0E457|nr:nucleotidyltransferase family protein [Roseovarius sp. EL26]
MRNAPDAVMLFAAGFGTRMGALTANCPKPMIPVAGKPLIDHALDQITDFGMGTIVANLHYKPEQIISHLARSDILFSDESDEILETGGGLRAALPLLGSRPVFTMNTDAVWKGPNPLDLLAKGWNPEKMDALLLCIPLANAVNHTGKGDFLIDPSGRASRGPGLVYSGLQILKTDGLHAIPERAFSLNLLWNKMRENQRLFAIAYTGHWADVGSPEGITAAESMLDQDHV